MKKIFNDSSLKKKMIFYFLLIAIANLFVAGEFIWELKSASYRTEIVNSINKISTGQAKIDDVNKILDKLANKLIIMIFILIIVSAVVLFLFVVNIVSPIQYMIDQAKIMSKGDLSIRVNIKSNDEISILGNTINELATKVQKMVAKIEYQIYELDQVIMQLDKIMESPTVKKSHFLQEIEKLKNVSVVLNEMIYSYISFTIENMVKTAKEEIKNSQQDDKKEPGN